MHKWIRNKSDKQALSKATDYFKVIINDFNKHPKFKKALLKIGIIESKKGDIAAAKRYFIKVKNLFPNSSTATLANINLQRLE